MDLNTIYGIAVYLLGPLPSQFEFAYIILALVISIAFVVVVLAPFLFIYKWFEK